MQQKINLKFDAILMKMDSKLTELWTLKCEFVKKLEQWATEPSFMIEFCYRYGCVWVTLTASRENDKPKAH